jgi:hypothetical protein
MYHQYWVNEKAGRAYCLMEGPDKESCAATHTEANGFAACQIAEIEAVCIIFLLVETKSQAMD